jgi:hypothetical protein
MKPFAVFPRHRMVLRAHLLVDNPQMLEILDKIAIVITLVAMVVVTGWVFYYYLTSLVLGIMDMARGGSGEIGVARSTPVAADSTPAN